MAHPGKSSSNPNDFILPDLGEGVHEAELIKWRVKVGDAVKEHDILAEMETDKALVEVPSPRNGVIAALHGSEGEILNVGNALVTYEADAGSASVAGTSHARIAPSPTHANNGAHATAPASPHADIPEPSEHREDAGTVVGAVGGALGGVTAAPGKALATPAVRRLARDLGVNIDAIAGSGIGGRVVEKDVRSASKGSRSAACDMGEPSIPPVQARTTMPAPASRPAKSRENTDSLILDAIKPASYSPSASGGGTHAPDEVTRIPFRGVRRTIANRLRESINQAVHFTVMDEADVSALDSLRRKLAAASGEKVSFLPFVASAVCRVLGQEQFRALNATVDEKAGDDSYAASIVQHRSVHLGIATDTDNGLMVPVIRDSDRLGVLQIGRAITQIAESARARTIPREQLVGSTFTISNVGSHAGRFATPVINYPEVGILAVGRGREGMVVHRGTFRVGLLLPLSLACDHRVVDGATAALALAEIIKLLQDPESLLAPAKN
jgi:pyruvate dehydrogenase E2 component (dihydrolipoamide acetyltransferase)